MEPRPVRVVLETERHRVTGTLQLPHEGYRSRVTEFLNSADRDFIALTDVEIAPVEGAVAPVRHAFVAVARRHVVLAVEADGAES